MSQRERKGIAFREEKEGNKLNITSEAPSGKKADIF